MNNWLKWNWVDWALIGLATIGVVSISPAARRWSLGIQDIGFFVLILALVWCPLLGWRRFARFRQERRWSRWRVWLSLGACLALSAAVVAPFLILLPYVFMRIQGDFLNAWFFTAVAAFVLGCFSEQRVRFPLILGGLGLVSLVILIPKGIL